MSCTIVLDPLYNNVKLVIMNVNIGTFASWEIHRVKLA